MVLNNRTWRSGLAVIILCLFSSVVSLWAQPPGSSGSAYVPGADDLPPDSNVECCVLAADWPKVARTYESGDSSRRAPVRQMLYAFACLHLNRNNDALVVLTSTGDPNSLWTWSRWTESLVQRHPANAVAQLLRGDAAARLRQFDSALRCYDEALRLQSDLTLARVAHGVAQAGLDRRQEAYEDLQTACAARPPLAEAYASLGTLIIRNGLQPEDANECYEKALALSPGYVLALNGLGCVKYAVGEWEKAPAYFVQAGRKLPLPLFLGNLRALMVAAENLHMPGQENSPLFRFSDVYDWHALRAKTAAADDVFRSFLGSRLPAEPNAGTFLVLNQALEAPGFCGKVQHRLDLTQASQRLRELMESTQPARAAEVGMLSAENKGKIVLLNRLILEYAYPYLIARHDQRDPGMQLTLTHGLVDQETYKESLTPAQIAQGQWNMDHIGRPIADALESSRLPGIAFMGKQLNDHFDFSTHGNDLALRRQGMTLDDVRPGGVKVDMSQALIDVGHWPVTNWFGLMPMSAAATTSQAK